jgi:hypothetical protein
MKQRFCLLILCIVTLFLFACNQSGTSSGGKSQAANELTVEKLKNAEYGKGADKVKLIWGRYEKPQGEGVPETWELVAIAFGDLNGDGVKDAAVIIAYNGGGSGTFFSIEAVVNHKGTPVNVDSAFLGDRVDWNSFYVNNSMIVFDGNSRFCPQRKVLKYQLVGGKLKGPKNAFERDGRGCN